LIGVPDGAPYSIGVPDPGVWRAHRWHADHHRRPIKIGVPDPGVWRAHRWHADHHRRPIKIGVPDPAPSPLYPQGEC
jgi:hypothetical protein